MLCNSTDRKTGKCWYNNKLISSAKYCISYCLSARALTLDARYLGDVMLTVVTRRVLAGVLAADAQVEVLAYLTMNARANDECLTLVALEPVRTV